MALSCASISGRTSWIRGTARARFPLVPFINETARARCRLPADRPGPRTRRPWRRRAALSQSRRPWRFGEVAADCDGGAPPQFGSVRVPDHGTVVVVAVRAQRPAQARVGSPAAPTAGRSRKMTSTASLLSSTTGLDKRSDGSHHVRHWIRRCDDRLRPRGIMCVHEPGGRGSLVAS